MGFLYPVVDAGDAINFGRSSSWYQTGDIEVEVVIRVEKNFAMGPIIGMSNPDTSSGTPNPNCNVLFSLELQSDQTVSYRHEYGNGSTYLTGGSASSKIPIGVWKRIKLSRVGTNVSIFVDGVNTRSLNYPSAPYAGPAPAQGLWIGRLYTGVNQSSDTGRGFSIAYAQYRGASNNVLFTYGQDPGGAPGAVSPEIGAVFFDPFQQNVERPVQTKKGAIQIDTYGGVFQRNPQRGTGYILDMTGAGGNGDGPGEINTPRSFPLEVQWKKANKATFEK